jgi:LysM repeat protein
VTPLDRKSYSLKVPKGKGATFTAALEAIPEGERVKFGVHVVERGDTLSQIARKYGTTVEALAAANSLRSRTRIHPGQVLTVPVPPGALGNWTDSGRRATRIVEREAVPDGEGEVYIVAQGDTLGAIADSFRMSLSELRALNDLPPNSTLIVPGQRLLVSSSAAPAPAAAPEKTAPIAAGARKTYVVRSGDTLGAIADAHGIGLSTLRRLNGMSRGATRIHPGQKLVVAQDSGPVATLDGEAAYRVRRGDSLTTIARRFGVSVDELRRWNQIESDRLMVGQSITIRASGGGQ